MKYKLEMGIYYDISFGKPQLSIRNGIRWQNFANGKSGNGVCARVANHPQRAVEVENTPGNRMALELSITRVVSTPQVRQGRHLIFFTNVDDLTQPKRWLSPEYRKLLFGGFACRNQNNSMIRNCCGQNRRRRPHLNICIIGTPLGRIQKTATLSSTPRRRRPLIDVKTVLCPLPSSSDTSSFKSLLSVTREMNLCFRKGVESFFPQWWRFIRHKKEISENIFSYVIQCKNQFLK